MLEMKLKIPLPKLINKVTGILWQNIYRIAKQCDDINVSISDTSPFSEYEYEQINRSEKLVFRKSPEVLKWKLDDNPLHHFRYYVARKENLLLSFLIVEESDVINKNGRMRRFRIIDWGLLSDRMDDLVCSYAKMLQLMKNTSDLIVLWMPTEHRFQDMFKRLRFIVKINKYFPPVTLTLKVLTEDEKKINVLRNKTNWQSKLIDTDMLL